MSAHSLGVDFPERTISAIVRRLAAESSCEAIVGPAVCQVWSCNTSRCEPAPTGCCSGHTHAQHACRHMLTSSQNPVTLFESYVVACVKPSWLITGFWSLSISCHFYCNLEILRIYNPQNLRGEKIIWVSGKFPAPSIASGVMRVGREGAGGQEEPDPTPCL